MGGMQRTIYEADHESFRQSVKEFLDREVTPHLEDYIEKKAIPREFWIEAGKQGFLGLEIPEEYGGSEARDYRFNAGLTEELAKVNMAFPSCVGIHSDIVAPYLVHLRWTRYGATMSEWMPTQLGKAMLTLASSSVRPALKR